MQVRRREGTWVVRWRVDGDTPAAPVISRSQALCRFCDEDPTWMELTDFSAMPAPSVVNRCEECGTATAHAVLPITSKTWDEAQRTA